MSWNGNGDKDPWGRKDGPPDIDEFINKFKKKLNSILGGKSGSPGAGFSKRNIFYGLILIVLIWAGMGIYQVEQAERSVVLRLGDYVSTKGPGLRWNPPIIDSWYVVDVVQVKPHKHTALMLTKDENIVSVSLSVQYQITNPENYILKIRCPDKDNCRRADLRSTNTYTITQATESALRHVVGSANMDDVLTVGREQIAISTKARLQEYLDRYQTGIRVVVVNIEDSSPPDQVQAAFDDVIKAREDEVRVRNEAETYANGLVPEARGQAQRMIQDAEAYRAQVVAESEGEATRFNLLLAEYQKAPVVTRNRLYLDAVQTVMTNSTKVLIDLEGSNNILYLPLDKIVNQAESRVTIAVPPSGPASESSIRELTNRVIAEIQKRNRR
jgi:membrane protease subunit HflK